jgi:hypothetical protein
MHEKLKETYDFSVGKILKRGRSITDGEFETRMRRYFLDEAEEAFVNLDIAEQFDPELLRQYLLVGAKIAVIDFMMRPETQSTIRSHHQKGIFSRAFAARQRKLAV